MNERSSLTIYGKWRKDLGGQDEVYQNDQASELLFKCRTNNMRLNDRRFWHEDTECDMCGVEKEDLKHFLLWCPAYEEERRQNFSLQQPYDEEEEFTIGKFLFDKENVHEAKITILNFWKIREKKRKEIENRPRQ